MYGGETTCKLHPCTRLRAHTICTSHFHQHTTHTTLAHTYAYTHTCRKRLITNMVTSNIVVITLVWQVVYTQDVILICQYNIGTQQHTHTHMYHTHTHTHTHTHSHICTHIHIHTYMYKHKHTHMYPHVCHTCTWLTHLTGS